MEFTPVSIIAICVFFTFIDFVAVALRFWVRLRMLRGRIGVDDWLILGGLIFFLGDAINMIIATTLGLQGRYYPGELPPDRSALEEKADHVMVIIEKPLYAMMKLSVLFFYRRIFLVQGSFRIASNILIILIIVSTFAFTVGELAFCNGQPTVLWDPGSQTGSCANHRWLDLSFGISDVIGDVLVIILPYPYIRMLQITLRDKIGITLIFLLGTLSTAASIVRLVFVGQAFEADSNSHATHSTGTPPAVWSTIEAAVGMLAACLPALGPLLRRSRSMKRGGTPACYKTSWPVNKSEANCDIETYRLREVSSSETISREPRGTWAPVRSATGQGYGA